MRYAFDELNRLVIRDPLEALRPARVLEGRVSADASNRLVYHVAASSRDGRAVPRAIALDGAWRLTPTHELVLSLHETQRQPRQTLFLKGAVVKAEANALTFALHRHEGEEATSAQRLTLSGRWGADARNRLNFLVEKADGSEDRLTLQGGWELGKHHEILYRYRQRTRARGIVGERTLIFDGAWDITGSDRLVYRVSGSSSSAFEFKASLQSPSLRGREGRLVYQVGVGLTGGRTVSRRVTLFGTWKPNRDRSVSFEVPYAEGRREAIRFNAAYGFSRRHEIAVELLDRRRQPLGISVTFSRRFLDDARWFLRLRKSGDDAEALAGVHLSF